MPTPSRETVSVALFNFIAAATVPDGFGDQISAFVSTARNLDPLSRVAPEQCPALRFYEPEEDAMASGVGMPTKWERHYSAFIYTYAPDSDSAPLAITQMNNILDSLEDSLPTLPRQNLGIGRVLECRIHGKVQKSEGIFQNMSIAIVPIKLVIA